MPEEVTGVNLWDLEPLIEVMGDFRGLFKIARLERRVVTILYRGRNDISYVERDIEVYDFDERYVDAFCRLRQDQRAFRIDRFLDAELLAERYEFDPGVAAQIASTGWSHRTPAWRRAQMGSVRLDEECDLLFA